MSDALSPQTEQYIADALAAGRFASRSELIEVAVRQLCDADLAESLRLCDEAIDDIEAGNGIEMTPERWDGLRDEILAEADAERARRGK
jgi:Arc/MetJ-type ribon-helix-helix transcriptional regulator